MWVRVGAHPGSQPATHPPAHLPTQLGGGLPEKPQGRLSPSTSLPAVCGCLRKAALDPRVAGVYLKISPLGIGWAKLLVRIGCLLGVRVRHGVHLPRAALNRTTPRRVARPSPTTTSWFSVCSPQELRRHVEHFKASGKFCIAYIERGGEKEYLLATACTRVVVPPTAQLSLRGFTVSGTFLRGALDKVGVQPQVRRIGQYKSAGECCGGKLFPGWG